MGQSAMKELDSERRETAPRPMTVGEILRRARIHYNQSPLDIERALRIKAAQIEAIEGGNFSELPGRVYTIGFIRAYSEYLGLDGEKMIGLFKSQTAGQPEKPELHFPVAASETRVPPAWLIGGSAAIAVLILAIWISITSYDRAAVNAVDAVPARLKPEQTAQAAPSVPSEPFGPAAPAVTAQTAAPSPPASPETSAEVVAAETETPVAPQVAANAAAVEPAAAAQQGGIILKIIENSWVEIKDSKGAPVVSRVLKAGDKYFVPNRPDLLMSVGNSGGVRMEIDGKTLSPLGEQGQVLRNLPLDAAALKKKYARLPAGNN